MDIANFENQAPLLQETMTHKLTHPVHLTVKGKLKFACDLFIFSVQGFEDSLTEENCIFIFISSPVSGL